MEDQRLATSLADPLLQSGPADQFSGDLGFFLIGNLPGYNLAALDVDHQIAGTARPHAHWWAGR